jgi:outer membrane immunogenic protein
MKKLVLALTALAAFTGSASAADLAARPYTKAPAPVAYAPSWTGCYIAGGGGGAMTKNDHHDVDTLGVVTGVPGTVISPNLSTGADGWFGTVGAGCDYQFNNFVVGIFGDYDFMDVKGDVSTFGFFGPAATGSQKMDSQWAVGGRVGYLVMPQLLTYVSGGYTQAHWKSTTLFDFFTPGVPVGSLNGATKGGWFIGAGDEYALSFLPGLFWKTEYRYSEFDRTDATVNITGFGAFSTVSERFKEHSVRSELVYRFNWAGPVVAKY